MLSCHDLMTKPVYITKLPAQQYIKLLGSYYPLKLNMSLTEKILDL